MNVNNTINSCDGPIHRPIELLCFALGSMSRCKICPVFCSPTTQYSDDCDRSWMKSAGCWVIMAREWVLEERSCPVNTILASEKALSDGWNKCD